MCGIFGMAGLPRDDLQCIVEAATAALGHRGPDGQGCYVASTPYPVALGHRRLSIIDLSPEANQPFWDSSDRYVIVFNGEVYNYKELIPPLEAAGHLFRTRSDTEVVLAALVVWGEAALPRLDGMFALLRINS